MSTRAIVIWGLGAILALNSIFFMMPVPPGTSFGGWVLDFFVSASFYWVALWILAWVWSRVKKLKK